MTQRDPTEIEQVVTSVFSDKRHYREISVLTSYDLEILMVNEEEFNEEKAHEGIQDGLYWILFIPCIPICKFNFQLQALTII